MLYYKISCPYCQHLLFCDFEKKNDTEPDNLGEGDHTDPKAKAKESPNVADQADPGHKTNESEFVWEC